MRTVRIYEPKAEKAFEEISLSAEASHHLAQVLRMRSGDGLRLFNGQDQEFAAEIISIQKKAVIVRLLTAEHCSRESPCQIELAQVISKGERMEWLIQKAVELGVSRIYPLLSERAVVRLDAARMEKKQQQWQAIAIAACEQCGRNFLPQVAKIQNLQDYLQQSDASLKLLLDPRSAVGLRALDHSAKQIALLIGPEGGLSQEEVMLAAESGFLALNLGPRVLRTETAALTTISLIQHLFGDL